MNDFIEFSSVKVGYRSMDHVNAGIGIRININVDFSQLRGIYGNRKYINRVESGNFRDRRPLQKLKHDQTPACANSGCRTPTYGRLYIVGLQRRRKPYASRRLLAACKRRIVADVGANAICS